MALRRATYGLITAMGTAFGVAAIAPPTAPEARARSDLSPPGTMEILPTLKGHMARLGTLMNFLFRNVDEESRKAELISALQEMQVHLRRSKQFEPIRLHLIVDAEEFAQAKADYHACLIATLELTANLEATLRGTRPGEPRTALLRLDQKRRDCHVTFG